jgi:hypothetical protein
MSRDPHTIAPSLPAFEALLRGVPWFLNLGKPHPRDSEVVRVGTFDDCPGPAAGYGDWFGRYPAVVRERVKAHAGRRSKLAPVWNQVERSVIRAASANVPGAGEGDADHAPSRCMYDAGYIAALVAWHVLLSLPVPDPIAERWTWFADGHWACAYSEVPPGFGDESLIDVPVGKLVVF